MADNVVDINIKANIDTKDVQKEMSKIADNTSRKAADVLGKFMDNVTKSVNDVNSVMSKLDSFKNMDIFSKASEMVESLKDTKGLDTTNTKLLTLENSLMHVSKEILSLQDGFDHVYATAQKKIDLESKFGNLSGLEQRIEALKTETDELEKSITDATGKSLPGSNAMGIMDTWQSAIEKSRSALQSLQNTRDQILARDEGTEEWRKDLEEVNQAIVSVTSSLGNASKAFYKFGRSNNFGQTKQDIIESYQQLSVYYDKMRELRALMDARSDVFSAKQSAGGQDIINQFSKLVNTFNQMEQEVNQINNGLGQAGSNAQKLGSAASKTHASMSQMRNAVWSISRVLGNVYTIGLDIVRNAKQVANIYKKIWDILKGIVGFFKKLRDNIKKTNDEHKKSWKQMLRDVVRYSLGIRSLFMLFRRLRSYIKEAFGAMAEQIPEVNRTLSELKSSFNQVKGSLATALEPIISALAAGLTRILALLSQVLTYIGMFFAAFSGRSYVYQANKAMTSFADSTGGAAKNMKELNKQLQGFDELNNLTTNNNNDNGGGGAGPLAQFEKTDIPDWIKKLADLAKKIWNAIITPIKAAWDQVKDYVVSSWKRAAKIIAGFFLDIVRDFLRAWAKYGEPIFVKIFQIVGDIGMIVGNIAQALRDAWNEADNGYKIWSAILHIIYFIVAGIRMITEDMVEWTSTLNLTPAMTAFRKWLESLVPVAETVMEIFYDIWNDALKPILDWTFNGENSGIVQLFNIFRDFNKKVNWQKLRTNLDKIWKAVGRFGQKIGQGLLDFINGLADRLADWINSEDFEKTCDKIVEFLDSVKTEDIKDDLEQTLRIVKNLAGAIWDAISYVLEHKDQILDTLEWASKHIKSLIALFITFKSVIDIGRFVANIYLMVTAIQKVMGAVGGIAAKGAADAATTAATTAAKGATDAVEKEVLGSSKAIGQSGGASIAMGLVAGIGLGVAAGLASLKLADFVAQKLGYEGGWKEVKEIIQKEVEDIAQTIKDGYIPAIEEMHKASRLDNYGDSAGAGKQMQEFHDAIIETNDDLRALNQALEDNNVKVQGNSLLSRSDNVEALKQVNEGLAILEENGNDVNAMLSELAGKYGEVESGAYKYFDGLRSGKEAYIEVQNNMRDYINTAKQTAEELPTIADIDKKFDQSMMGNLDRLPSAVAEKMKQTGDEGKAAIDASSEEVRLATQDALKAIEDFQTELDNVEIDWSSIFGNFEDISTSEDWSTFGSDIITGITSGVDSNQTQAFDSMNNLASGMVDTFHNSALQFGSPSQTMYDFGLDIITGLNNSIEENQGTTISVFDNYAIMVVNSCTNMRNSIIDVFNGLASDIGTILTDIAQAVATTFNDISNSISGFKSSMNSFTGGINASYNVNIPKLAQGAVIPPNNEFLAVLGDQKHGTNIESPLSTMVEAFNMANKGGNEQELALLQEQNDLLRQLLQKEFGISDSAIFDSVKRSNSQFRKQTGASAFA